MFLLALTVAAAAAAPPAQAADLERWSQLPGPPGGNVFILRSAPSDARFVYAGNQFAGMFRSEDGGATWSAAAPLPTPAFASFPNLLETLAIDPRRPEVVYAGTAWGLLKSVDGGRGWVAFPHAPTGDVRVLAVDPARPERVYAVVNGQSQRLLRSDSGGRRWKEVGAGLAPNGSIQGLDVDPAAPDRMLAVLLTSDPTDRPFALFRSLDGGATWTRLARPRLAWFSDFTRDRTTGTLYVAGEPGLLKTDDGGATWVKLESALFAPPMIAAVTAPRTLYATSIADGSIVKSLDGGATWQRVLLTGSDGRPLPFGDAVGFAPVDGISPGRALAGTFGRGVWRTEDGGGSWRRSTGFYAAAIASIAIDPTNSAILYVGTTCDGAWKSVDGGAHWREADRGLEPFAMPQAQVTVPALLVDPGAPRTLFAGAGSALVRSGNGGRTWAATSYAGCPLDGLVADPTFPALYAISDGAPQPNFCDPTPCAARRSLDGGFSWDCIGHFSFVFDLVPDPAGGGDLYAAADFGIWKSADHGSSFSDVGGVALPPLTTSIALGASAPGTLYEGELYGVVRKSVDGGASWAPTGAILPGGQVSQVLVDPRDADRVYALVPEVGLFRSLDGGRSWQPFDDGLPPTQFFAPFGPLAIDPRHPRRLYLGSGASGLYTITVP